MLDLENTSCCRSIVRNYLLESLDLQSIDDNLDIIEEGIASSLFTIQLMTFLEKNVDIKITMEDLDLGNFKSINTICSFVQRKKNGMQNV